MSDTKNYGKQKNTARGVLFWFGAIFTIIAPIFIGTRFNDPSTSWVAALCGAFITFISKLDDIAELSLGPVRAKMRETIQEANATIEQVQKIASNISEPMLSTLMAGNFGFRDGLGLSHRLDLHDSLVKSIHEIGVSDKRISEMDKAWARGIGVIYYRAIAPLIDGREEPNIINSNATKEQNEAREGWDKLLDFDNWQAPTPDQMKSYIESIRIENTEIDEWIDDYRNYIETGEIRRRDIFVTK